MHDLGAFGNGSRMKYVANLLVAINNVAAAEAMVLGMKSGLDAKTMFEMVTTGAGNSRVFELRGPMMVKGRYDDATMKVALWQKDMAVIGGVRAVTRLPDAAVFMRRVRSTTPPWQPAMPCTTPPRFAPCSSKWPV